MKKVLFILLTVSFCFATSNVSDDKRIIDSLLKYNYGIIKMTKSGDTHLLEDMLSQDVYFKLMIWADSWKFSNLAMVAQINDLKFSPIAYNEYNATIRTMENWTFGYANLVTKDYALKPMTIFYKMHYTLQKDGDIWKIIAIKHLEEKVFTKPETKKASLKSDDKKPKDDMLSQTPQSKIATH